jgi:hypothetical protein
MAHIPLKKQFEKLMASKNLSKLKFRNGETIDFILRNAANELKDYIYREMAEIYRKPEGWYSRSFMFSKSLDEVVKYDVNNQTITINFNDNGWHDSWITKKGGKSSKAYKAFVPQGIREGYSVFKKGFIEPNDYLKRAVDKFNNATGKGIKAIINEPERGTWWK